MLREVEILGESINHSGLKHLKSTEHIKQQFNNVTMQQSNNITIKKTYHLLHKPNFLNIYPSSFPIILLELIKD